MFETSTLQSFCSGCLTLISNFRVCNFPTKQYHSFSRNCNSYIQVSFVFSIGEGDSRLILQARRIKVANYSFICPSRGIHVFSNVSRLALNKMYCMPKSKSVTKYPLIYFLLSSLSLVA